MLIARGARVDLRNSLGQTTRLVVQTWLAERVLNKSEYLITQALKDTMITTWAVLLRTDTCGHNISCNEDTSVNVGINAPDDDQNQLLTIHARDDDMCKLLVKLGAEVDAISVFEIDEPSTANMDEEISKSTTDPHGILKQHAKVGNMSGIYESITQKTAFINVQMKCRKGWTALRMAAYHGFYKKQCICCYRVGQTRQNRAEMASRR